MTTAPASRELALALVRRARGRTFRHRVVRAAARGIAAGALFATALAAVARILGFAPGAWLLVALVPALALALPALLRARPGVVRAALLLDRAAGTKERFATAVAGSDPEVRELAARQAVGSPAFRDGAFPLAFPPTTEGLVAVLSLVLLAALLLLVPAPIDREGAEPAPGRAPVAAAGAAPAAGTKGESGESAPASAPAAATSTAARAVAKLASGEGLDEDEWRSLAPKGVSPEERARIEAALGRGDPAAAAGALRAALAKGVRAPAEGAPTAPAPGDAERWAAYRRALANPVWSPEHDDVVRRYFDAVAAGR